MIHVEELNSSQTKSLILEEFRVLLEADNMRFLESFVEQSATIYAAFYYDDLLCMFGFIQQSLISGEVYLWMQETPKIASHRVGFARASKKVVANMLDMYDTIIGHCKVGGPSRWITWAGGTVKQILPEINEFTFRRG